MSNHLVFAKHRLALALACAVVFLALAPSLPAEELRWSKSSVTDAYPLAIAMDHNTLTFTIKNNTKIDWTIRNPLLPANPQVPSDQMGRDYVVKLYAIDSHGEMQDFVFPSWGGPHSPSPDITVKPGNMLTQPIDLLAWNNTYKKSAQQATTPPQQFFYFKDDEDYLIFGVLTYKMAYGRTFMQATTGSVSPWLKVRLKDGQFTNITSSAEAHDLFFPANQASRPTVAGADQVFWGEGSGLHTPTLGASLSGHELDLYFQNIEQRPVNILGSVRTDRPEGDDDQLVMYVFDAGGEVHQCLFTAERNHAEDEFVTVPANKPFLLSVNLAAWNERWKQAGRFYFQEHQHYLALLQYYAPVFRDQKYEIRGAAPLTVEGLVKQSLGHQDEAEPSPTSADVADVVFGGSSGAFGVSLENGNFTTSAE